MSHNGGNFEEKDESTDPKLQGEQGMGSRIDNHSPGQEQATYIKRLKLYASSLMPAYDLDLAARVMKAKHANADRHEMLEQAAVQLEVENRDQEAIEAARAAVQSHDREMIKLCKEAELITGKVTKNTYKVLAWLGLYNTCVLRRNAHTEASFAAMEADSDYLKAPSILGTYYENNTVDRCGLERTCILDMAAFDKWFNQPSVDFRTLLTWAAQQVPKTIDNKPDYVTAWSIATGAFSSDRDARLVIRRTSAHIGLDNFNAMSAMEAATAMDETVLRLHDTPTSERISTSKTQHTPVAAGAKQEKKVAKPTGNGEKCTYKEKPAHTPNVGSRGGCFNCGGEHYERYCTFAPPKGKEKGKEVKRRGVGGGVSSHVLTGSGAKLEQQISSLIRSAIAEGGKRSKAGKVKIVAVSDSDPSTDDDTGATARLLGFDSMANVHIVSNIQLFMKKTMRKCEEIEISGAGKVRSSQTGTIMLHGLLITDVIYAPDMAPLNLISMSRFLDEHTDVHLAFAGNRAITISRDGAELFCAKESNGLFLFAPEPVLKCTVPPIARFTQLTADRITRAKQLVNEPRKQRAVSAAGDALPRPSANNVPAPANLPLHQGVGDGVYSKYMMAHRSLGHPGRQKQAAIQKEFKLDIGRTPDSVHCLACDEAKSHRSSARETVPEEQRMPLGKKGDIMDVDMKQVNCIGYDGYAWITVITSRRTGAYWVILTKTKAEIPKKLRDFANSWRQLHEDNIGTIKMFRSDNGTELFLNVSDADFWAAYGCILSTSAPYTPNRNGRAEASIKVLMMVAVALLRDSEVADLYWPFAIIHACFLLMRRPVKRLGGRTPFELLWGRKPTMPLLQWGGRAFWFPPKEHAMKKEAHTFSSKGFACHFLGFHGLSETTFSIVCNGKLFISNDVTFPKPGALIIDRSPSSSGTEYWGPCADAANRTDIFPWLTDPLVVVAPRDRPDVDLSGRAYFHGEHDADCKCGKSTTGRTLLKCEYCCSVSHIKCAGLTRIPQGFWMCVECSIPAVPDKTARKAAKIQRRQDRLAARNAVQSPLTIVTSAPVAPTPPNLWNVQHHATKKSKAARSSIKLISMEKKTQATAAAEAAVTHQAERSARAAARHRPPVVVADAVPEPHVSEPSVSSRTRMRLGERVNVAAFTAAVAQVTDQPRFGYDRIVGEPEEELHTRAPGITFLPIPAGFRVPRPIKKPRGGEFGGETGAPALTDKSRVRKKSKLLSSLLKAYDDTKDARPSLLAEPVSPPGRRIAAPAAAKKKVQSKSDIARAVSAVHADQAASDKLEHDQEYYKIFWSQKDLINHGGKCFVAAASGLHPHKGARLGESFHLTEKKISKQGLTRSQSLASPDAAGYQIAMEAEKSKMNSPGVHHKLCAFEPVLYDPKTMRNVLTLRHVNTKKEKSTGTIFDSRLCIRGFGQRKGTYDPQRVSSSVCSQDAVKMSIAFHATHQRSKFGVVDGRRAFLQSPLVAEDGDIYVWIPEGWEQDYEPGMVLKVNLSVYGLKQSCYNWCELFDTALTSIGFVPFICDPRSYRLDSLQGENIVTYAHAHVDDTAIIGMETDMVKEKLSALIDLEDRGYNPPKFCGMEFIYGNDKQILVRGTALCQSLLDLCKACGVELNGKACPRTPMVPGSVASLFEYAPEEDRPSPNDRFYRGVMGIVNFGVSTMFPSWAFAFNVLSKALGKNTVKHDEALLHLILYIKGTSTWGIVYGANQNIPQEQQGLTSHTDSSFADGSKAKSTEGFSVKFNGCLVKWSSRSQQCVAFDTMEAEYIAASSLCRVLLWLLNILQDMRMEQGPVLVWEDNQATVGLMESPYIPRGARHINVRHHIVRGMQWNQIIKCMQCSTLEQEADFFTKALDHFKTAKALEALGMMSTMDFVRKYGQQKVQPI